MSHFQEEGDSFLLSVRIVGILLPLSEVKRSPSLKRRGSAGVSRLGGSEMLGSAQYCHKRHKRVAAISVHPAADVAQLFISTRRGKEADDQVGDVDDAGSTARQQPITGRRIMQIKSIVAGAAVALAAAIGSASAAEEFTTLKGVPAVAMAPIELAATRGASASDLLTFGTVRAVVPHVAGHGVNTAVAHGGKITLCHPSGMC